MPIKPYPVVIWQSPDGHTKMAICKACETRLTAAHDWPRDASGQELCQVRMGTHPGYCEAPGHSSTISKAGA